VLFVSAMGKLDAIDRHLLRLLQDDDQQSLGELGRAVGLAPSSVKERIRRLREDGAITAFQARLAPEALGLDLLAFMFVGWPDPAAEAPFLKRVKANPAVLECHHVTGAWNYILKLRLANTRDLEAFLNDVKTIPGIQRTETLIALSSAKDTTVLTTEPAEPVTGRAAKVKLRRARSR
jgi:Lrp/AsnC family transcriptional regulator, leucine-responsive regulatory protein